jgi:hypothetical protein
VSIVGHPHPLFASLWFSWYGCVLAALVTPSSPWFGFVVLVAFLPVEAAAVWLDTGARDTLSETVTWIARKMSKQAPNLWPLGWNALIACLVLLPVGLLHTTFAELSSLSPLLLVALDVLVFTWLYTHWLRPDVYG